LIDRGALQFAPVKRFRQWLFNGIAVLSLVLCIAITFLWMRSPKQFGTPPVTVFAWTQFPDSNQYYYFFTGLFFARGTMEFDFHRNSGGKELYPIWKLPKRFHPQFAYEYYDGYLGGDAFYQHGFMWVFLDTHYDDDLPFAKGPERTVELTAECPEWFLIAVFGILPAIALVRYISIIRQRSRCGSFCVRCGYDLRATPDRCPECGAIPTKS
jgi:hypothetical protein